MKKLFTLLLVLISIGLLAQSSKIFSVNPGANSGSRSLTGSYVVFDPSVGGDPGYIPGGTANLIFRTESYTPDWEYVYHLWLKFPDGWTVNNVALFGTPSCDNGGTFGSLNAVMQDPPNVVDIQHSRYQSYTDHCQVYYMVTVTVGPAIGTVDVSWYWSGDGYGSNPHHPCSSDGYAPQGWDPCTEMINPPAEVPQYYASLDCANNAIFSQPPIGSDNAYFSDESIAWNGQRIFENFFGLTTPIGGITFWGIMWDNGECFTPGSQNFEVTFYQDQLGTVGNPVQNFLITVTPAMTENLISGSRVLRYDITLPSPVNLQTGWFSVYKKNPGNSYCTFAWARTNVGDNLMAFSQSGPIYTQVENVSFCLSESNAETVPVSNWALFIAIGLILVAALFRFRKLA